MTRWLGLLFVLLAGSFALSQEPPDREDAAADRGPERFAIEPFGRTQRSVVGVAGVESRAAITGDGRTALALYAFGPHGNCVAFDDEPSRYFDDRVVAWTSTVTGLYDVQYRNLGARTNRVEAIAK
jgi:hypothetical protein